MPSIDPNRERPIPEHVRGLVWHIDDTNRLAFNSYGTIDWYKTTSYGIMSRIPIESARCYAAALMAMLAAYDQRPIGPEVAVRVEHFALTSAVRAAEEAIAKSERTTRELREVLEQAKLQVAANSEGGPL